MSNPKIPKRPANSVFKWSDAQGAKWIRQCVRCDAIEFSEHAFQRAHIRSVTHEQAIECILKGVPSVWEDHMPPGREPDRRMTFKHILRTKIIKVVVVVSDGKDVVIIATVISPKL